MKTNYAHKLRAAMETLLHILYYSQGRSELKTPDLERTCFIDTEVFYDGYIFRHYRRGAAEGPCNIAFLF